MVLERILLLPHPIPIKLINCGLWIMGLPADNPRISACHFFSFVIATRAGLELFDNLTGSEDPNEDIELYSSKIPAVSKAPPSSSSVSPSEEGESTVSTDNSISDEQNIVNRPDQGKMEDEGVIVETAFATLAAATETPIKKQKRTEKQQVAGTIAAQAPSTTTTTTTPSHTTPTPATTPAKKLNKWRETSFEGIAQLNASSLEDTAKRMRRKRKTERRQAEGSKGEKSTDQDEKGSASDDDEDRKRRKRQRLELSHGADPRGKLPRLAHPDDHLPLPTPPAPVLPPQQLLQSQPSTNAKPLRKGLRMLLDMLRTSLVRVPKNDGAVFAGIRTY